MCSDTNKTKTVSCIILADAFPYRKGTCQAAALLPTAKACGDIDWFGGHSASDTPDPIPNSAVKRRRADGTASQDVGE